MEKRLLDHFLLKCEQRQIGISQKKITKWQKKKKKNVVIAISHEVKCKLKPISTILEVLKPKETDKPSTGKDEEPRTWKSYYVEM